MPVPRVSRPGRSYWTPLLCLVVGALLGGLTVSWWMPPGSDSTQQDDDRSKTEPSVFALGRLEPAGGLVSVFGTPGDRIVRFQNDAGRVGTHVRRVPPEELTRENRLVVMASDELREKETEIARQQYKLASDQRKRVEAVARARQEELDQEITNGLRGKSAELSGQRSKLEVARREVREAEAHLTRLQSLTSGSIAGADLRKQEFQVERARTELQAAEEAYQAGEKALQASKDLGPIKREAARVEAERARLAVPVESADLTYQAAQKKEKLAWIVAPVDGTIVRVQGVAGETTTQVKPILEIAADGRTDGLVVRAEIPEADVATVRAHLAQAKNGLSVQIRFPSIKDPAQMDTNESASKENQDRLLLTLKGKLASPADVARTISRNAVVDLAPSTGTDRRVVEAIVQVTEDDPTKLALARTVLGIQVEIKIHLAGKPNP